MHQASYPSLLARLGYRARWHLSNIRDRLEDMLAGVDTRNRLTASYSEELKAVARPNEGTNYLALNIIAKRLNLNRDDVFFDIGCGFGRPVLYYAKKVKRCVGIELRPEAAAVARRNLASTGFRNVDIIEGDATEQDYTSATIIYLYNPFNAAVMERVLDLIRAQAPGARICYVAPVEQATLEHAGWLKNTDTFDVPYDRSFMKVMVWAAR